MVVHPVRLVLAARCIALQVKQLSAMLKLNQSVIPKICVNNSNQTFDCEAMQFNKNHWHDSGNFLLVFMRSYCFVMLMVIWEMIIDKTKACGDRELMANELSDQ